MKLEVLICFASLFAGCAELPEPTATNLGSEKPPTQIIWNGKIEVIQGGKLQSLIQAGLIKSYEKNRTTWLDSGVVVDFYDKQGRHNSTLTADRAKIEEAQNLFMAEGGVVVTSDSGAVLKTERLYWDKKKQRIRSDTLVTMTSDFDSLRGYQFESNEDLTSWQLQRPTGQTFRRFKK